MHQSTVGTLVLAGATDVEREALLSDMALTSLQGAFTAVPDPRSRHGQRYPLAFLLTCLVAALLCNCNSLDATGQWCREQRVLLARVLRASRSLLPALPVAQVGDETCLRRLPLFACHPAPRFSRPSPGHPWLCGST